MNANELLHKYTTLYPRNECLLAAELAFYIMTHEELIPFLELSSSHIDDIQRLIGTAKLKKINYTSNSLEIINKQIKKQCVLLGVREYDYYVLLLASLKLIKDKSIHKLYKLILGQILKNSTHRLETVEFDSVFIGRKKELNDMQQILSRHTRNNVLIVGKTGVGKTTLGKSLRKLFGIHLYQLAPSNEDFYDQVLTILSSDDKKVFFFLDEIVTFEPKYIKYLIDNAQVIGTANDSSYKKFAGEYPHIISKFEVIQLDEPEMDDLTKIFTNYQQLIMNEHPISFEHDFLDELIKLSKQFMNELSFPAKGISLLEDISVFSTNNNHTVATKDMIKILIAQKTGIPIGSLTDLDRKDLSQLPDKLQSQVKGQNHAVEKVARVIQKSRLGLGKKNRPIGSFLFVGPSGVGKTELAKAVAKSVFGDEEAMVRLDMSEFSEAHMVQRLIGSPPGYIGFEEGGQLTNPVCNKPYSLILLDEIEKAHPRIFDIFLQVLDDGRLTDGQGKKVDFTNTIIIATSNAGIEDILDLISEGRSSQEIDKEIKELLTDYFRIEFLNRFDDIIIFNALSPEALKEIASLYIAKLKAELAKRNIDFSVSETSLEQLSKAAYDPKFGARGLLRLIQEAIENKLAELIIQGEISSGSRIEF